MLVLTGMNYVELIVPCVLGVFVGALIMHLFYTYRVSKANLSAAKIIEDANTKADNIVKESILDAKTQAYEIKLEAEKEAKEKRREVTEFENKLLQREQSIDRRSIALQGKEDSLEEKLLRVKEKQIELGNLEAQLQEKIDSKITELEKIAAMSANEAKEELFKLVEQKMTN